MLVINPKPALLSPELTVHVARFYWFGIRKGIHDKCEECPYEQNNVCKETERTHPEGPWLDIRSTADEEAYDGYRIA